MWTPLLCVVNVSREPLVLHVYRHVNVYVPLSVTQSPEPNPSSAPRLRAWRTCKLRRAAKLAIGAICITHPALRRYVRVPNSEPVAAPGRMRTLHPPDSSARSAECSILALHMPHETHACRLMQLSRLLSPPAKALTIAHVMPTFVQRFLHF